MGKKNVRPNGDIAEPDAVRTTIVGGRPPANGVIPRHIPRGLEVLIKKAAVDPTFKKILFEKRAAAAEAIGLKLTGTEQAMLAAVPLPQLEGIIAHTRVSPGLRPAFLGYAAGAMLAALGVGSLDYALVRSGAQRERDSTEMFVRTLKTYPVRYKSSPKPIRGLRDFFSALAKGNRTDAPPGKDVDSLIYRHLFSTGIRPTFVEVRDNWNPCADVGPKVWLTDSLPTSIKGSAAGHPARSPDAVGGVFRRHAVGVYKIYRSARAKNPSLAGGEVVVEITILPDGTVGDARVVSDTLDDAVFRRSLLARIRNWRFPPTEEGDVTVIYPFIFVPEAG